MSRKKHKDIVLAWETAASAGSLVNHVVVGEVAPTAPDLRLCTLQYIETVDMDDEISKAFETIRLEDPHLEIKEHSIPPEMGARDEDQSIILAGETAASVDLHVNLMAGDEAASTAPNMQRCMLQCSETVDSDDETFEAIDTIRLEDPHIGIKEYPITPDIDDGNNDIVLVGETVASDGSRGNLVVGGGVADIGRCMLQCSEIDNSDDETSSAFETIPLEDPHLGIREPTLMSRNNDIILAGKTVASNGSLVNLMEGDVVARTAPDVRRHVLQRSETVHLDDKTSKAFLRLVDPCLRIRGYTIIPPQIGTRCIVFRFFWYHVRLI
ncbi:uncharacterized protein BJ212DRAFT_460427 [Suillus subaureus]|uniref:Uncharacterized protein n=1 Tax=Suillus subaureus TaxID=48587 RepID=A0A9P7E7G5_9AGAM|nr:uncharacterized protein BJ212DRAFT_460427 [Suillus subaureus]KAG1812615.1 hypothetical protein BJ212DRAFT_460427 [Suillus subaureus]